MKITLPGDVSHTLWANLKNQKNEFHEKV